jgi:hypothetical protein
MLLGHERGRRSIPPRNVAGIDAAFDGKRPPAASRKGRCGAVISGEKTIPKTTVALVDLGGGLAAQPREDGPPPATVSRPGSVQRVDAVDVEMDEEAGAISTW